MVRQDIEGSGVISGNLTIFALRDQYPHVPFSFQNRFLMKKAILIVFISWVSLHLQAQNSIGLQVGYLGTYTSVAEYIRVGRSGYLLDSMSLAPFISSLQAAFNADIDMGKNFFLSTGFHYSSKGLSDVTFYDTSNLVWSTAARQHYLGISLLFGYHFHFKQSKWGLQFATGPQADFAVGTPNNGALFSGSFSRFFMPFSRFNEVDLSWVAEAGCSYKLGPGVVIGKLTYQYGLSDVLEDAFIVARAQSFGISVGYSILLSE